MNIISYIGTGKENAVTRSALCAITGLSDRAVRQEIENARHDGEIIVGDTRSGGYYLPSCIEDIERQFNQNKHRALSILHYQKPLRHALKQAGRL